jgi:HD-like signal output (HDOD) protein
MFSLKRKYEGKKLIEDYKKEIDKLRELSKELVQLRKRISKCNRNVKALEALIEEENKTHTIGH